jgi:hypothetical protein
MEPDLSSVLKKLRHAERHFEAVNDDIKAWLETSSNTLVPERNDDFTKYALVARFQGPAPDLERWSLGMGDAVSNLRDCLDHLIYAIARFENRDKPSAKIDKLSFVIADDDLQFDRDARKRLMNLSTPVVEAVRSFQPYNRPHETIRPILAILRDLSNSNKHRILQMAFATAIEWDLEFRRPTRTSEPGTHWINQGEIKDGEVVSVFQTANPAPDLYIHKGKIGICIALWHGFRDQNGVPGFDRSDYSALFRLMLTEVRWIVNNVRLAAV